MEATSTGPAEILRVGDPRLRWPSHPVTDARGPLARTTVARLYATLAAFRAEHGFGRAIAAPQIGKRIRMVAFDLGPGPRMNEAERAEAYHLSQCMTCGCCLDACPQVNDKSAFMGAAAIAQVVLFNSHPIGRMNASERTDALMGDGGIVDCGNAQNCVRVCPKDIPLTWAIAKASRATNVWMFTRLFDR